MTCFVVADHARDKVTRRLVTSNVLLLNNTPVPWLSKQQKKGETSTYGSELVAARIATDLLIEWRYKLRMLGVKLEPLSWTIDYNILVVTNTTILSSYLKKNHQACNYHTIRAAIAGRFITFGHFDSASNVADICTKPLVSQLFHFIAGQYLFWKPVMLKECKN